ASATWGPTAYPVRSKPVGGNCVKTMSWYSASSRRQQAQTSTCALRWSYSSPESCPPAARTISSAYCSCSINLLLQRLWHRGRLPCSFHARLLGASLIPGSNNFELVGPARPCVPQSP